MERRLATILAADAAGYSRFMRVDERGTTVRQKAHRTERIDPAITEHSGPHRQDDGPLINLNKTRSRSIETVPAAGESHLDFRVMERHGKRH